MSSPLKLKAHRGQKIVLKDRRRFKVIVAGRRWGKTQISKIALIQAATTRKNQLCWYVAPTYQMARQILWEDLKRSIPKALIVWNGINETRMTIRLVNGSRIELKGADNPDTLRGVGINFLVLDEAQDMKEETWKTVLRPTLASTGGQVIFIGTPKAFNWLYDMYVMGQRGDTYKDEKGKIVVNSWKSWQFPTIMSPFIPRSEIETARREMDPKSFRQEFEASFESMSGRVYYPFDRRIHVGEYPFNPKLPIIVGQDFNIDPMSSVIMQVQPNGEIWVVDEAILPGSNTQETADELGRRYHRHMNNITVYPDPAGNNRTHARGESSLEILRDAGFTRIKFKRKHPAVDDRINSVNRLLMDAEGTIRLRFDRKAQKTIEAMEQTIYKAGTRDVDKKAGVEHPADALGYFTDFEYPVRKINILGVSL
ncbi:terminase family protein [Rhizobium azibense]|nr:terminase family protein [Rhizobium azibense]